MKATSLVRTLVVILVASSSSLAGLVDGLVAYYPFNGNAYDASGNGHHGIAGGDPTQVPGRVGGAYYFDGIDDYIQAAANAETIVPEGTSLTVTLWMNMHSLPSHTQRPIGCEATNDGFALSIDSAELKVFASTGTFPYYTIPTTIERDLWYHIAMVYKEDRTWTLFVDGVERASMIQAWNYSTGDRPLIIAADAGNEDYPWMNCFAHATIDEVRIYNRGLIIDEIKQLATVPVPAPGALLLVGIGVTVASRLRTRRTI